VDPEPDPEYPTTFYPLPDATLDRLSLIFAAQNPGVYATLNEYGFPERSLIMRGRGLSQTASLEALIAQAKATIVANAPFTGVADTAAIDVKDHVLHAPGGRRAWLTCWFGAQLYEGLTVKGSRLSVTIDSVGALDMDGAYFPAICIPEEPLVSSSQAQDNIVGLEIEYWVPGARHTYVVEEGSLLGEPDKLVLVHEIPGAIELRVVWRIPVWFHPLLGPWWYVYVDTMSGDDLEVEQLVRF